MDALNDIQEDAVLKVNAEEKPWRKPGVDISDYFNYGFDEESWNAYYQKQTRLHAANKVHSGITKGHERHEEKGLCSSDPFSNNPPILASSSEPGEDECKRKKRSLYKAIVQKFSKQSRAATDVTGGQPEPSGVLKGHLCLRVEESNTQGVTEMHSKKDRLTPYNLYKPSNISSPFAFTTPSSFCHRLGPPRSSSLGTLDSGEERKRHRDTAEQRHKHHNFERFSGEIEQYREGKHRDRGGGWQKSYSNGSSSRRVGGEDRDSQSRRKKKKAKRNEKGKTTSKMFPADQERKLKYD